MNKETLTMTVTLMMKLLLLVVLVNLILINGSSFSSPLSKFIKTLVKAAKILEGEYYPTSSVIPFLGTVFNELAVMK